MSLKYDAVVAGGGPAGSLTAFYLARRGARVLLVEKKQMPRYKPCGGGLTRRALNQLPFDPAPVVEDFVFSGRFLVGYRPVYEARRNRPIIAMVMRDRFDRWLLDQAEAAGAVVRQGVRVEGLSGTPGDLTVVAGRDRVRAFCLAGADGVTGTTRRLLDLPRGGRFMQTLEAEAYYADADVPDRFKGRVDFDFGVVREGYGWVFPKSDHLSVGVGTYCLETKNLRAVLSEYLASKDLARGSDLRTVRPHLIPVSFSPNNHTANRRGLLVGDAAGFTDPVTGEGLYYALHGARIAAAGIFEALKHGPDRLPEYRRRLALSFRDVKYAAHLSRALYRLPRFSRRVLKTHGGQLAEHMIDITSGQETYFPLYKRLFTPSWLLGLGVRAAVGSRTGRGEAADTTC